MRVRRGSIGVAGQTIPLPQRVVRVAGLTSRSGVVIVAVEAESPAAQANLEQGEIILALDGEPVSGVDDLVRLLNGDRIGHSIELRLLTRGEMRAVTLTPVERKTAQGSR